MRTAQRKRRELHHARVSPVDSGFTARLSDLSKRFMGNSFDQVCPIIEGHLTFIGPSNKTTSDRDVKIVTPLNCNLATSQPCFPSSNEEWIRQFLLSRTKLGSAPATYSKTGSTCSSGHICYFALLLTSLYLFYLTH